MKLLGVDYGTKRVGLATGDTETMMAFPLRSVDAANAVRLVLHAADAEGVHRVVVGVPTSMTGGAPSETELAARRFVDLLRAEATIPIDTEDERMTTMMVEKLRKDAGIKKESFDKDAAAAAAILETYMERTRPR